MADEGLTNEVKQFLRTYIQSIEQLEILAQIKSDPSRAWTTHAIYERILTNERSIAARLTQFATSGLIAPSGVVPGAFVYAVTDEAINRTVDETLQAYKDRRVLMIETIFRPQNDPAQTFANAFRFKRS